MAAKWIKELMAIFAHKENSDILCAELLHENGVDFSGLSVQQNDGSDESDTTLIITSNSRTKSRWIFPWEDGRSWH